MLIFITFLIFPSFLCKYYYTTLSSETSMIQRSGKVDDENDYGEEMNYI